MISAAGSSDYASYYPSQLNQTQQTDQTQSKKSESDQSESTDALRKGTGFSQNDEYLPSQATAEKAAVTYKPPSQDTMSVANDQTSDAGKDANEEGTSLRNDPVDEEGTSISVQTSSGDATGTESVAAASTPLESESTESTDSADTIGKPSWISDENWAAIQENPDQQPSDMSDEDWQAYLEWAGKSTSSDSQQRAVRSEQAAVTEGTPPGATVTLERAESTTQETTTQSVQENANRYSRWNSGNLNVGPENRINVTT